MRPWLAFIWAKILAVDPTCQAELFKENGDESTIGQPVLPKNQHVTLQQSYHGSSQHSSQPDQHSGGHHHHRQRQPAESQQPPGHPSTPQPGDKNKPKTPLRYLYFVAILNDPETSPRQKIVPAFVLATLFHNNYKVAQENLTEKGFVNLCTELLCDNDARECRLLKLWILIGLGRLWSDYNDARWQAVILELDDESPEVRAAAAFAIGSLLKNSSFTNEHATVIDQQLADQLCKKCTFDGAVLVREELIVALQWFVFDFEQRFVKVLLELSRKLHFEVPKKTEDIENEAIDIASHMPSTRSHADRLDSTDAGSSSMYKKKLHSSVFVSAMEETVSQGARRKKEIPAIGVSFAADYEFEDEDYRRRALLQIKHLEGSYGEPVARAWLALLRLSLDPMQHVARMAQRIVKRVEMQSHKMKETISEKLATLSQNQMARQLSHIEMRSPQPDGPPSTADFFRQTSALSKTSDNGHVRFVVGSPATAAVRISPADRAAVFGELFSNDSSPVASEAGDQRLRVDSAGENFLATSGDKRSSLSSSSHPPMKFAVGSPKDYEDEMKSASVASEEFLEDILSNTARTFTPKRVTTGRGEFTKEGESVALRKVINDPLVSTQFIPWCSRVFVEPIMQVLQSDATDDRTSDEVLTRTSPSDWAMHQLEGHRQTAETDLKALRNPTKGQSSSNPSQVMTPVYLKTKQFKNPVTAVATSKIRKCVYATDGEKISIIVHEKDVSHCRTFDCNGGNPFTNDHVSQLITINEEAREMILCCSPIGIIRIWDPCYDSFSAGYERVPVLLTSAFPLMEYTKYSNTEAACLFDWNQSSGRVLCTGPKSVRIWDAHYEKTIQDIHYPQRSAGIGPPTALSGDLDSDSDLVAVGFSDGSVDVYDLRMPKHRALRLALETTLSSVMHLSLRRQENSNGTVFASNRNGLVVTWEPRMYKEPVQKLQIPWPKESHKAMSVHSDATHFVTTSADLIRFYDVNGPLLARLRGKIDKVATEKQNGTPFYPEVTAITMQQIRYQVVAGFSDKTIGIFAPGATIPMDPLCLTVNLYSILGFVIK
ncbi:unnamed protein product [Caenorhabditis auriculariae]|uniref:Raptor N-terminal CASPase-like domain-containing protein n=1 Tax=Caenorhabditis auriculariae TaxID=2777116 RepID=A0A8S1H6B9_9PELO|nr:unnamed protein product [Caenorhabditis auriculariae]